jgi:hypothetical protein
LLANVRTSTTFKIPARAAYPQRRSSNANSP